MAGHRVRSHERVRRDEGIRARWPARREGGARDRRGGVAERASHGSGNCGCGEAVSTRGEIEKAQRLTAEVSGILALMLERGRDLTPGRLDLMIDILRQALRILAEVRRR